MRVLVVIERRLKMHRKAHEAIRPTHFDLTPSQLENELGTDELKVYELVWKRTMASQMTDARVLRTTYEITATGPNGEAAVLSASGKSIEFPGFRRAYVEGSDDPAMEIEEQEALLPPCQVGDHVAPEGTSILLLGIEPKRHETIPPARFTEASLIKETREIRYRSTLNLCPNNCHYCEKGVRFSTGKSFGSKFYCFCCY